MSKSFWMEEQNGNFSNNKEDTFDPEKRYVGIRLQQGVPLLDRDWNELEDIRRYEETILRKWYVGNGVPPDPNDGSVNGFKIFDVDEIKYDFKIAKGRCLVDGFEAVNKPPDEAEYILYFQQEGVDDLTPPSGIKTDLVYLDVWIEEVTSEEDEALGNSQDVNIETCIRHKLEWRVRVRDEGSSGYQEELHHYYDIAKIKWGLSVKPIIVDSRNTGLSIHRLNEVIALLTNN